MPDFCGRLAPLVRSVGRTPLGLQWPLPLALTCAAIQWATGCGDASGSGGSGGTPSSLACGVTCVEGDAITPEEGSVKETSGLVASKTHPGVLYTHNDSGDSARFFAVGGDGAKLGTYHVTNADAVDWEDMARGPCADPARSCLYIGDIGDNAKDRATYVIYRVEEPATLGDGDFDVTAEVFPFVYENGSHDAETLLVHPMTGQVYVVSKEDDTRIYSLPLPLSATTMTAQRQGNANVPDLSPLVTGGDIRNDGGAILLRTKQSVWRYELGGGDTVEAALERLPCEATSAYESQGEAVAFGASGDGYFTMGEGKDEVIHVFDCP